MQRPLSLVEHVPRMTPILSFLNCPTDSKSTMTQVMVWRRRGLDKRHRMSSGRHENVNNSVHFNIVYRYLL